MKHTAECIEANQAWEKIRDDFVARYPNYCRECGGWGFISGPGCSVPYGETYVSLPDEAEPCSSCSSEGLCARCGAAALNEDGSHCRACGYDFDDGIPEPPGCICPSEDYDD